MLKRIAFAMAERSIAASYALNAASIAVDMLRYFPSRYRDNALDYTSQSGKLISLPGNSASNDLPLSFFKSVILGGNFDWVVELGSYSLDRSREIKRLFPTLSVSALDVTRDFAKPQVVDGVEVGPNSIVSLGKLAISKNGRGLICTSGTLAYYPPDELPLLFKLAKYHNLTLAISEPNTVGEGSITRSLKRTHRS